MTDQDRATALAARIGELLREGTARQTAGSAAPGTAPSAPGLGQLRPSRSGLDRELQEIGREIIAMGTLVEEALRRTVTALRSHDAELASRVIADDRAINDLQRSVSELVTVTIATQSPVARDLRTLLTLDHVAAELERMGDYAASVAKQARKLAPLPPFPAHAALETMVETAAGLVHDVLPALVDVDADRARAIAARDDELDTMYHALFAETLRQMAADTANVDPGARVLFAAHYTERVGDRTTNIAEDIVFLALGELEDLNQ